jgi:hypothetical protein
MGTTEQAKNLHRPKAPKDRKMRICERCRVSKAERCNSDTHDGNDTGNPECLADRHGLEAEDDREDDPTQVSHRTDKAAHETVGVCRCRRKERPVSKG